MSKRKFNYIDIMIILVILVVGFVGFKYVTRDDKEAKVSSNEVQVSFVAEADPVLNDALQQLSVGDTLVANGVFQDAVITNIEIKDSASVGALNGELIMVSNPENKKVLVTITGKANKFGPYIDLGGQEIKAGSKYYIKTDVFEAYGMVVNILEIKE
jgi:hypothetical protein